MGLISVVAELERMGWAYSPASEDEIKTNCPFHEDKTASCTVNIHKLVFHCKSGNCAAKGDFISFLARALVTERAAVIADLSKRYDIETVKAIEPSVVEKLHARIWEAKHLLKELYLRGVTDADIRKYRLGFGEHGLASGRISIPIKNHSGTYVNIRYYLPGAPASEKMRNTRGRGKMRLFPIEQLAYDKIVICGGEMKAVVSARLLNPLGIGAITASGGEGNWDHKFSAEFKGKHVWVMMDIDPAGVKSAQTVAALVHQFADWVGIVKLPLDAEKYPKGDVNDFVGGEGGDLAKVVTESTERWLPPHVAPVNDDDEVPLEATFSQTVQSDKVGRRVKFQGVVSATAQKPYIVPKRVLAVCDKSADCCSICAVFPRDDRSYSISPESQAILQMVNVKTDRLDSAMRAAIGIPAKCNKVGFEIVDHYSVEDVRLNPSLDICNRDNDRTMQQALCVTCEADLNTTYDFIGRMYPHPETQQATLILSKSKTTHDALSRYQPMRLPDLRVFRPVEWTLESLEERLDDIYTDLEANVTKIWHRRDIHLMIDLAYHSVLLLDVDGKTTKGWVEVLIVGDSGQGKSEAVMTMKGHYSLGEKVDCKNASVAGLLGGLSQMGTQWYVAWGVIPTHDRMLVILEELKGADPEMVISKLTDMRSSGIAEIPKIEKRRSPARTRIVAVSNPRDDRVMSSYSFGVEAIRELIGAPEDVRRFDAALIVDSTDCDPRAISALVRDPPQVRHRYTGDICRELILWAWTRTHQQVSIDTDAADLISTEAASMSERYSSLIPIVDGGSMRHKLSRLSASIAARTFSTGKSEHELLVRKCHVEFIVKTLRRIYDARTFGYNYFSDAIKTTTSMIDHVAVKMYMEQMSHPHEVREQLLYVDQFDLVDIQDWCGCDREEAQKFLSLLVRKRAIKRGERKYHKTAEFIAWLKGVELKADRPDHVKNDPNGRF